jgi:hypothetical protein
MGITNNTLLSINKCRLYLRLYFLSDISNLCGTFIRSHITQGRPGSRLNTLQWPTQGKPTINNFSIWSTSLRELSHHIKLAPWSNNIMTTCFYSSQDDCLFQYCGNSWLCYTSKQKLTHQCYFSICGTLNPEHTQHAAYVSNFQQYWACHGYCTSPHSIPPQPTNLAEHIASLP